MSTEKPENLLTNDYTVYVGSGVRAEARQVYNTSRFGLTCGSLIPTTLIPGQEESKKSIGLYLSKTKDSYTVDENCARVPPNTLMGFSCWYMIPEEMRAYIDESYLRMITWAEAGSHKREWPSLEEDLEMTGKWVKTTHEFTTPPSARYIAPLIQMITPPAGDIPLGIPVVYADHPTLVYDGVDHLPPDPLLTRNTLFGSGLMAIVGGMAGMKYPIPEIGRALPVITSGLGAVIGGAAGGLTPELKLPELPLTGENRCPVCGVKVADKPLGEDVRCESCGFVSAWSR